jgi:hypothetical protein
MRRDSLEAVAKFEHDSKDHELRINDNVTEVNGTVGGFSAFVCSLN